LCVPPGPSRVKAANRAAASKGLMGFPRKKRHQENQNGFSVVPFPERGGRLGAKAAPKRSYGLSGEKGRGTTLFRQRPGRRVAWDQRARARSSDARSLIP